jgi:hypothetical protein
MTSGREKTVGMDTLLLVEEAAGPLSVRCLESDRVALSPRFSGATRLVFAFAAVLLWSCSRALTCWQRLRLVKGGRLWRSCC